MLTTDAAFIEEFYRQFEDRRPLYQMALVRTRDALLALTRDRDLFTSSEQRRVRIEHGRVKEANRLLVKAQAERYAGVIIEVRDIFNVITDVAGTRVTCNTIEDVRRFEKALLNAGHIELLSAVPADKRHEDYIASPKDSGYRALHFLVEVPVPSGAKTVLIPCEVQIRTLLQHAWGELTHEDTFKPEVRVPPLVSSLSKRLATALAVLDEIAQDLRDELNKIEKEPTVSPEMAVSSPKPVSRLRPARIRASFAEVTRRELIMSDNELRDAAARAPGLSEVELQSRITEADAAARSLFSNGGVLVSDREIVLAAFEAGEPEAELRGILRGRAAQEESDADFMARYARGTSQMGTLVRVTRRYAIVQFQDGGQGILSARHYEEGRTRIDLQDVLQPGGTVWVEIVNIDLPTRRIEVRPR